MTMDFKSDDNVAKAAAELRALPDKPRRPLFPTTAQAKSPEKVNSKASIKSEGVKHSNVDDMLSSKRFQPLRNATMRDEVLRIPFTKELSFGGYLTMLGTVYESARLYAGALNAPAEQGRLTDRDAQNELVAGLNLANSYIQNLAQVNSVIEKTHANWLNQIRMHDLDNKGRKGAQLKEGDSFMVGTVHYVVRNGNPERVN